MIDKLEYNETIQYPHKVLRQYVKKNHLDRRILDYTTKVNKRFVDNEQMITANTIKFNELLSNHDLSIINKIDDKTDRMFWKFTKLSVGMLSIGLAGSIGTGLFVWNQIDKLDTKIDNIRIEMKDDMNKLDIKMNHLDTKMNEIKQVDEP